MADYIVKDTELTSVANAIRTAGGTSSLLNFPNGFVNAVNNISGGSSDFSTAQVTVINNSLDNIPFYASFNTPYGTIGSQTSRHQSNESFDVIIHNNLGALLYFDWGDVTYQTEVTGNIEKDNDDFLITGDCTITIS